MAASTLVETLEQAKFLARYFDRDDLESATVAVLMDLRMEPDHMGYQYLKRGILHYCDDPAHALAAGIYQILSEEYDFRPNVKQLEQAMRRAINEAWEYRDERVWRLYFYLDCKGRVKKPSNIEFIAGVGQFLELWQGCCKEECYEK